MPTLLPPALRRQLAAVIVCAGAGPACLGVHAQPATVPMSTPVARLAQEALAGQPGMAVAAAWRAGKTNIAGAYSGEGVAAPVTEGPAPTLFEIGSISKVFTGLLLAQAVEAGDLRLDDTLATLLRGKAEFTHADTAAITLRQLVTHTSCLPRLPPDFRRIDYSPANPYRNYDRPRMWTVLGTLKIPQAAPCDARYSNFGFGVLGELLSEHYGKPWAELVRERITAPLGMRNTTQILGEQAPRLAPPYDGATAASPWDMIAFAGAGGLRSTPEDLLLFGRAILAGAQGPLGAAAARLVTPLARFDGQVGYGLFVNGPATRPTWSHTGGTGGYRSSLTLAPDTQEVVVLMASNAQSAVWRIANHMLVGRYPVENATYALDPARLTDYTGVFREHRYNAWTVVAQDGQLHVRGTGQLFIPLTPSGPDRFNYGARAQVVFARADGKVTSIQLRARGDERYGHRTAELLPAAAWLPQEQLQAYVGRYRALRMDFTITAANGHLFVQPSQQDRQIVYPVAGQPDRFAWDTVTAELQFERYPSGAIRGLVLHQNGRMRAERLD